MIKIIQIKRRDINHVEVCAWVRGKAFLQHETEMSEQRAVPLCPSLDHTDCVYYS